MTEERVVSKQNCRGLTAADVGAPATQDARARVECTWDAFYNGLGADVTSCPTGETIIRYIDTMTRQVKPHTAGKPAPSLSTIHAL